MLPTLLLALLPFLSATRAGGELERIRLDNGLTLLLRPLPEAPAAVVMLGLRAGVHDEPEERSGLAHLAEHLFFEGGTASAPAGSVVLQLSAGGPVGKVYADANAETMWDLTYFYALRRPGELELALRVFAEKLGGVDFDEELLEREREKASQEVRSVERNLEEHPQLRAQIESLARRPKAGTLAGLAAASASEVQDFLARHYRPDRALLVIEGAFEAAELRALARELFEPLRAREVGELAPAPAASGAWKLWTAEPARVLESDEATLRVLATAWQRALRAEGRAFVELSAGGLLRAAYAGAQEDAPASSLRALRTPLAERELDRTRREAAGEARRIASWLEQALPPPEGRAQYAQALAQRAIWRLQLELAGGATMPERIASVEPAQVAELARQLAAEDD